MRKLVVFDLDDTLFPEHQFVLSGFDAVDKWLVNKYSISGFLEVAWNLFQEGKRQNIFDSTLEYFKVEYDASLIIELLKVYREHHPKISLYEDAKWAISHFKYTRKIGLITDGYLTTQRNKVKALAIEANFDEIVYSDLYGRENWKPSPTPYCKIMESMRFSGAECVYVGDNPRKDFVTAKKLDWMTVRICRVGGEYSSITADETYDADIKIASLVELKEIL